MAASALALLGQTIREIRIERGMTQQQLADLCDRHRTFIIAIEKGRQNASTMTLIRIASALRVLPSELFVKFTKSVMRGLPTD
ncbi:MAG TPA: helix-turn-helix transcriptional regulator [Thermoanaerobaculia bacterium]|nr:helix-turn-helix transcriptional regulator [Thermoanaerobaculia bacterium]